MPRLTPAWPHRYQRQGSGVFGVIAHGVGAGRALGAAEAALVVGEQVELLGERRVEDVGLHAEVAAGAGDEQQASTRGRRAFVIDGDAGRQDVRHAAVYGE